MPDYTATAIAEGDHWEIDIPGIGSTQADSMDELEQAVVHLVMPMTHAAREGGHVEVRVI